MNKTTSTILAAAVSGLFLGAATGCKSDEAMTSQASSMPSQIEKHACKGLNQCKGQGGCAVEGKHGCAGHNECAGHGGCATVKHECKGHNDCKGQGGCEVAGKHACKGQNECKGMGGCKVGQ